MRILVTGPESSGTKMLTRILTEAGGDVLHRPIPTTRRGLSPHYTGEREEFVEVWGNLFFQPWDTALVLVRDWFCTLKSQEAADHRVGAWDREERLRVGITTLILHLQASHKPWRLVTYESLAMPEVVDQLCYYLGLDPTQVMTEWKNANAKYYGGEHFSDRTSLWERPTADPLT